MKRADPLCGTLMLAATLLIGPVGIAQDEQPTTEEVEGSVWDDVVELYERAKAAGEQVPKDIYEWVHTDLESIGDWEYRVESIDMRQVEALERQLNELGADRWECIWIQETDGPARLIFKRPVRSYLKHVPLSQLLRAIPGSGGDDG